MARCYILHSKIKDSFYIGYTTQSIEVRLHQHNTAFFGTSHYTASTNDWQVFICIECDSVQQAIKMEAHLKLMKSKKYLEDLKKYPELLGKLRFRFRA